MYKWMKIYNRVKGKDQGIFLINVGDVAQPKQLYKGLVSGDNNIYKYIGTSPYEFNGNFSDKSKWEIYGGSGSDSGEFSNKKLGDGLRLNSGDNSYVEAVNASSSEAGIVQLNTLTGSATPSEKTHKTLEIGDTLHNNTSFIWGPTGDSFKYTGPTKVLPNNYNPTIDDQAEEYALITDIPREYKIKSYFGTGKKLYYDITGQTPTDLLLPTDVDTVFDLPIVSVDSKLEEGTVLNLVLQLKDTVIFFLLATLSVKLADRSGEVIARSLYSVDLSTEYHECVVPLILVRDVDIKANDQLTLHIKPLETPYGNENTTMRVGDATKLSSLYLKTYVT